MLRDAHVIINRGLLYETRDMFKLKLKDKKYRFNKLTLRLNQDTIKSLKVMNLFFKGYDTAENKEKYTEEFLYPFENKTAKQQRDQEDLMFLLPDLFFSIKNLSEVYAHIHKTSFSKKATLSFFKDISAFEKYYDLFKTDRFDLHKHIPIKDLRKIYLRCIEMKKEIYEFKREIHG